MNSLFRQEVLAQKINMPLSPGFIEMPIRYKTLAFLSLGLTLALGIFILVGEYSEKFVVKGYLEANERFTALLPFKRGILTKSYVNEGDWVNAGQKLFLIDTHLNKIQKHENISLQLKTKLTFIDEQLRQKKNHQKKMQELWNKKFISHDMYQHAQNELTSLIDQKEATLLALIKQKETDRYVMRAPITGVLVNINYQPGEFIPLDKPLAKIIPPSSSLHVKLFLPHRIFGYLDTARPILIHFDAYPYAREYFKATITSIRRVVAKDNEEENFITIGEPYYVALATLEAFPKKSEIHKEDIYPAMTLSAHFMGKKRKIWQWIFDPLYLLAGK